MNNAEALWIISASALFFVNVYARANIILKKYKVI